MTVAEHKKKRAASTVPFVFGGAAAVVLVGAVAGVVILRGGSAATRAASPGAATPPISAATAQQSRAQLVSQLVSAVTVSPAAGATGVTPDTPVTLSTAMGQLGAVTVTPAAGGALAGALDTTSHEWQSSATLALSTSYRVDAVVQGPGGVTAPYHATFTTVTPTAKVSATLFPLDGQVMGVGQPVVVRFSRSVTTSAAQAAVLSHLSVAMSETVAGGWKWFSSRELHFRPQAYWPSGEKVVATSNLDGWNAGGGAWGETGAVTVNFSVGASHVSTANLATHQMTVTVNGAAVATYPLSAGSTQYPTMVGTHIAMDKESVVHMISSSVGIPVSAANGYDEMVYSDVHISDSGEYVHAAPWSTGSQGRSNVSHGCVNLSPTNASAFFNLSQVGDVIVVTGGPRPPALGDHGVMDWSTDFSQFTPATVATLASVSTPAAPATPGVSSSTAAAAGAVTTKPGS